MRLGRPTGSEPGTDYHGRDAVRAGFMAVIEAEAANPGSTPPPGEVIVLGERAMSMWSYPITRADGTTVIVEGVDLWTFEAGRIKIKDAYRKSFADPIQ